jgi:hypothetical protein
VRDRQAGARQHDAPFGIARERGEAGAVDRNLDRIKAEERLLRQFAQVLFVADTDIAPETEPQRDPREDEDRQ